MSQRLAPAVRLHSSREFQAVQAGGRRISGRFLTLVGRPNRLSHDRLGLVASRRIGGAVERNRAKRRIRELFRRHEPDAAGKRNETPLDMIVIARRELVDAPLALVEIEFRTALRKLKGAR